MNILDIILIIPILWFLYRGFTKGFIIELASLIALIGGIWAAIHFSYFAGDFLGRNFDINEKYLGIIAFIVTFLLVVFAVILVGRILEKFINVIALGFLNKLAGAIFGILKAAFILSIIIFIINSFDPGQTVITPKMRSGSLLYKRVEPLFPMLIPKLKMEKWNDMKDDAEEII